MGDYGLKLWENDALTLISSFRPVLDQKSETKSKKNGDFDPSLLSALGWVYGYVLLLGTITCLASQRSADSGMIIPNHQ